MTDKAHTSKAREQVQDGPSVVAFPRSELRPVPPRLPTIAERGLGMVTPALVQQLGRHGAYNRLLDEAESIKPEVAELMPVEE